MHRRDLLKLGGLCALGGMAPGLFTRANAADVSTTPPPLSPPGTPTIAWDRSLVLIELRGGNDGLNTIVPFADPEYYRLRPTIGVRDTDVVRLDQRFGLHPALTDLRAAWDDGGCAAVLGVGYPKPNLSHFRGIEIWNTAADETSEQTLTDGWLSRLYHLAAASAPTDLLAHSITLSSSGAQAHEGLGPFVGHQEQNHFVIDKPEQFIKDIGVIPRLDEDPVAGRTANPALAHVRRLREEITLIGQRFSTLLKAPAPFTTVFPETSLGNQLKSAARFITGGALCPTYKCTIDGFDTHSSQRGAHDYLLKDISSALAAFRTALKSTPGAWERTLVVTYSEFGRRARENGSEGTDHGTAAPMLLLGGRVKPGFHGTYPDLKNLVYDDLGHTTDFRSVYQGIARDFLGFKPPFLVTPGLTPLACCVPG